MVGDIRLERCADEGWDTRAASLEYAPWGVDLAKSIPPVLLKRFFAIFLGLTVLRMVWRLAS